MHELLNEKKSQQYKEHRNEFIEMVNNFGSLGQSIYKSGKDLKEISETINRVCGLAEVFTLNETEDWFDKVTVNRNMKELTTLSKSFGKFAQEAQGLQERMSAVYEDMGHIVGRYYEIDDEDHVPGHEEDGDSIEEGDYEEFFKSAMDKFGISSPDELDDEKKKKFFNYVDKNYKAKSEGNVNEGKWAVNFELGMGAGDATIVVDANGKGQAKTLVAKQLKKGLKSIIGVKRVQSGFASQMDKKLGDD